MPKELTSQHDGIFIEHSVVNEDIVEISKTFEAPVSLEGCNLNGKLSFRKCIFKEFVMFRGTKLPDRAEFIDCIFLKGCSFAAGLNFSLNKNEGDHIDDIYHLKFDGSEFHNYVTFNNRAFKRSASFKNCTFYDPPHFQNAALHHGTKFSGSQFIGPKKKYDKVRISRFVSGYRRLKYLMKDRGSLFYEYDFHALELQGRKIDKTTPLSERFTISLYQLSSNYGRDIKRPILFFAILTFLNYLILILSKHPPIDSARFIVDQSFSPFSISTEFPTSEMKKDASLLLGIISLIQGFLGLVSFSLFLFTVQRKFK